MDKLFPVYEVGSLPKLAARVKAFSPAGQLTDTDIADCVRWGRTTGIQADMIGHVREILSRRLQGQQLQQEERMALIDYNALLNIRLQEQAGLDVVYDGEARRIEMYEHMARQTEGFEFLEEPLRSRGPDSWRAAKCISAPRLRGSLDALPVLHELAFAKAHATAQLKVPMDDPYMIACMTVNEHYKQQLTGQYGDKRALRYEMKRSLTLALAQNVIRPHVEQLAKAGASWIQLDIPAATIDIDHIPIVVEGVNAVVQGIEEVKFSLHLCYPKRVTLTDKQGYELLFPHILKLHQSVNHLSLELANNNQYDADLEPFAKHLDERRFEIGLGVIDITLERQQKDLWETPQEVMDRILRATSIMDDPSLISVAPDCGLRQVTLDRAVKLYKVMAEGAMLARKAY